MAQVTNAPEETRPPSAQQIGTPESISRAVVFLLSLTAGCAVAGLYYIQPLLAAVAQEFHVTTTVAGLAVTATQFGYILGLGLLVPVGELVDRRKLIAVMLVASAVGMLGSGLAWNFTVLAVASLVAGLTAAAAQVTVPFAAHLAPERQRGKIIGTVMSGLLLGILGARVAAGLAAGIGGWRTIFFVAAACETVLAVVVWRAMPKHAHEAEHTSYLGLLRSIPSLVRQEPVLRQRMTLGFFSMAGFSALWTSIAFLLAGSGNGAAPLAPAAGHYHFTEEQIGLFGLAGVAGALGAPVVGALADAGRARLASSLAWVLIVAGWGLFALGGRSVVALLAGLVVFDLGVQAVQISNQNAIYQLRPAARSRMTSAYMTAYFFGGVAGSAASGAAFHFGGWPAVCWLGLVIALIGSAVWAQIALRRQRPQNLSG